MMLQELSFWWGKGSLYEPNKFLANMNVVNVPQDKNRAMWYDGTYYSM